jgi:hypothetical protein
MRVINLVLSFANLQTPLSMPPGYEDMCIALLAVRMSPQYPAGILSPVTVQASKSALKMIGNINNVVPTMSLPSGLAGTGKGNSYAAFLGGY